MYFIAEVTQGQFRVFLEEDPSVFTLIDSRWSKDHTVKKTEFCIVEPTRVASDKNGRDILLVKPVKEISEEDVVTVRKLCRKLRPVKYWGLRDVLSLLAKIHGSGYALPVSRLADGWNPKEDPWYRKTLMERVKLELGDECPEKPEKWGVEETSQIASQVCVAESRRFMNGTGVHSQVYDACYLILQDLLEMHKEALISDMPAGWDRFIHQVSESVYDKEALRLLGLGTDWPEWFMYMVCDWPSIGYPAATPKRKIKCISGTGIISFFTLEWCLKHADQCSNAKIHEESGSMGRVVMADIKFPVTHKLETGRRKPKVSKRSKEQQGSQEQQGSNEPSGEQQGSQEQQSSPEQQGAQEQQVESAAE